MAAPPCRYWPKHLPMGDIQANLDSMDVGDFGVHKGTFLGNEVFIVYLKDEDYNSMFMSAFAPSQRMADREQIRCGGAKRFYYPQNHGSYYACRPFVDHANAYRMMDNGHAMEEAFKTHRVTMRDWTCSNGMSEANGFGYFTNSLFPLSTEGALEFRKRVAWEDLTALLPEFHYTQQDIDEVFLGGRVGSSYDLSSPCSSGAATPVQANTPIKKKRRTARSIQYNGVGHLLKKIPGGHVNHLVEEGEGTVAFRKIDAAKIDKYPQYHCSYASCKARVRSYCACQPAEVGTSMIVYCNDHFASHVADSAAALD